MAEKIGLEAILDVSKFTRGVDAYLNGLDKMNKETGAFDKSTANFGTKAAASFQNLGKVVAGAGLAIAAAGAAAGVAVGKFLADGISKAADFEAKMSGIAAVLNLTKEEALPLQNLIIDLGLDPNLKVNADDAAQSIENLAKNGLTADEILQGAARATVLLANATGTDLGLSADVASDAMAIFNKTGAEMEGVVAGIVGVTNASKFSVTDYAYVLGNAGPVLSQMGVSLEEMNAGITLTSNNFTSGMTAGTSWRYLIQNLVPPTDKAANAMSELGLMTFDTKEALNLVTTAGFKPANDGMLEVVRSLQEYFAATYKANLSTEEGINKWQKWLVESGLMKNAFFDVNGELKDMDQIILALQGAFGDLSTEQQTAYARAIFGQEALGALNGVLKINIDEYNNLIKTQSDVNAMNEAAAVRTDNLKSAWEIFKDTISTAQLVIGLEFLPVLTDLVRMLTNMASSVLPSIIEGFKQFASNLSDALTNMFAAIDAGKAPLDVFMAFMIGFGTQGIAVAHSMSEIALSVGAVVGAVGMALQPITDAIGSFVEWQDVLIVLGAALATVVVPAIAGLIVAMAPILLTFAAATLAVAALRTAWENDFLGIQTATTAAIAVVQENIGPLLATLSDLSDRILPLLKEHWDELAVGVAAFGAVMLAAQIPAIIGSISAAVAAAGPVIVTALAAINLPLIAIAVAVAGLAAAWQGNWFGIRDTTAQVVAAIQEKLAPFTTAVQEHMQGALAEVKAFATGNETEWTNVKAIWEGAKTSASDIFTSIIGFVTDNLPTWKTKLTEWGTAAGEWLITAAAEVSTKLGEWYTALSSALDDKLPAWTTAFSEWSVAAGKWLTDASATIGAKLGEWYTALSGALADKLSTWKTAFVDWIKATWQWIVDAIPLVTTKIGEWYTSLTASLGAKLATFIVEMLKWATGLVSWIGSTAADALPHLGTWLGKVVAWTVLGAAALVVGMLKFAAALVGWISDKAADAVPELGKWFQKVIAWIPGAVTSLVAGVKGLAGALVGWINGTGGVPAGDSAGGKIAAEFAKFTTALGNAITNIWTGIKGFVQALGKSFWDELGIKIDWLALGVKIISGIKSGVETVSATLTLKFQEIAKQAYDFFFKTDWLGLGSTVITKIKDGVSSVASTLVSYFGTIAQNAITKFLGFDWAGLGKNVISGILKGLQSNGQQIIDYIVGLGTQALDQIKAFFGIKSPSTVMEGVGRDIVRGLIKGIDEQQSRLKISVARMSSTLLQTIIRDSQSAVDAFGDLANRFSMIGGGKMSPVDLLDRISFGGVETVKGAQPAIDQINRNRSQLNFLQQQAALIAAIRESGGNPSEILAGIKIGIDADPLALAKVVASAMELMTRNMETSMRAAASGFPEYVEKLRDSRKSVEEIEAAFISTHLDQRERYAAGLAKIDGQIARLEADLLATGNKSLKPIIEGLDSERRRITQALQTYLEQTKKLQEVFATLKNLTGPGQTSAQKFVDDQIKPILDAFSGPMDEQERTAWLRTVGERVAMVNRFVEQMRSVELLQRRIEGNKAFDHLADEFATLTDILTPEGTRTSLLNTLAGYITQMQRLFAIQQDLTVGLQASPFVERFKDERLDTIARQLENINLSEAERGRLIEAYRMEQEKILAIQQKQSQLDFLKQQLDLLNQVKDLDDKFGELVPVADIFAGVQFGVNASLDSLLGAVSKAIDAMIRVTYKELGIASPSKVFEKVGQYMMGGLARGIETSMMRPINSLSGAISELPYALGGRSLTLNMGGVSISNGMDEVMFEARVRQILDRAFP